MKQCIFRGKVRLLQKKADEWVYVSCGSVMPNPIKVDNIVWVGSLSSRSGWQTSNVRVIRQCKHGVEFETDNSVYRIEKLEKKDGFDTDM